MRGLMMAALMLACCAAVECGPKQGSTVIGDWGELARREGRRVVIEGAASIEIWQHMIALQPGYPHQTYFDVGKGQIVVYSREEMSCPGRIRVEGTVIKLEGSSKNPRRKETCTEYHVVADSWECVR